MKNVDLTELRDMPKSRGVVFFYASFAVLCFLLGIGVTFFSVLVLINQQIKVPDILFVTRSFCFMGVIMVFGSIIIMGTVAGYLKDRKHFNLLCQKYVQGAKILIEFHSDVDYEGLETIYFIAQDKNHGPQLSTAVNAIKQKFSETLRLFESGFALYDPDQHSSYLEEQKEDLESLIEISKSIQQQTSN